MTPLAHAIAADSTLPIGKRAYGDAAQRLQLLDGVHFFEVSAVFDAARSLGADFLRGRDLPDVLAFLPAARTWLEWTEPTGRVGVLLEAELGDASAHIRSVALLKDGRLLFPPNGGWLMLGASAGLHGIAYPAAITGVRPKILDAVLYALLAMVNTPRVIGRRQHMPHAGLQRRLAASLRLPGKYPLHAWHELALEVTPPTPDGGTLREARLTGGKALHFVRGHLRIRQGRLERVSPHWRGDPALGIKQTRYRLVPPKAA